MDTITISDLAVNYHVGVPDAERAQAQRLLITVEMQHDMTAAAAKDDLRRTINYYDVAQKLLNFGNVRTWKLIESVASDIAMAILSEFPARAVTVTVKKFIIPEAQFVSVTISRQRGP